MKKIPASLQKMRYDKQGEIVQVVCLVDSVTKGGEYTLCGNAIPDSAMEYLRGNLEVKYEKVYVDSVLVRTDTIIEFKKR